MQRRIISLTFVFLLALGLTVPAYASSGDFEMSKDISGCLNKYTGSSSNVTIPNGVTKIGSSAFAGRSDLISVTIPNGVTSIGHFAFQGCTNLTSVAIPESMTRICPQAFQGCTSLTSVTIPKGVTSIEQNAFFDCSSLTSITIPGYWTEFDPVSVFGGCTSLSSIIVPNNHCQYISYDGLLFAAAEETLVYCPGGKQGEYTIPDVGVTKIGDFAFFGCTGLTSVTIPEGVTSIGKSAFERCSSLTSVTIPEGVTSIGDSAFWGCTSLTSVTIPDSVTEIGRYAFSNCTSLTSITLPKNVNIGEDAFADTPWQAERTSLKVTVAVVAIGAVICVLVVRRKIAIKKDPEGYARRKQEEQERKAAAQAAREAAQTARATERAAADATAQAKKRAAAAMQGNITCSCGTVNPASAKFCSGCGKAVVVPGRCLSCGHQNDPEAKFCQGCGKPLSGGEG